MSRPRKLRIAYGRLVQETNALSPVLSELADFERLHYLEGDALARACAPLGTEIRGMIRNAELSGFARAARRAGGVETVPLLSAWALPSGPLTAETYELLRDRMVDRLRAAGNVDGVFLSLHGAMRARGAQPEPEEGFLAAVRDVVGPEVPIAASYDLHGNMTPGKVDPLTILAAYRTNPHRDLARTGRRAGELLIRAARGEIRPVSAWRTLPMLLGGGLTIDFLSPMRAIFRRMKAMERDPRVLYVSLFTCHLWNDSPDLGWSVHVITDGDPDLAERLADELADRAWAVRHVPLPEIPEPEAAIAQVRGARLARRTGTVCLVDVSDVVGAGSVGENTHVLRALLEHGRDLRAYVPLRDAEAVAHLWDEPAGSEVTLGVGGRLAPDTFPPVEITGKLVRRASTEYFGRAVVVQIGALSLCLTELAPYTVKPSFYRDLGLDPWRADVVVVKAFFHFRIYYAAVNRKTVAVKTRGFTDLDAYRRLELNDRVFPKDDVDDWRPADARRRGRSTGARRQAG